VAHSIKFLEGRTDEVIDELGERMDRAAAALDFERAATLRDQIATLRRIQQKQYVTADGGDLDIIACVEGGGSACVQVFFIRAGRNLGNKAFFPRAPDGATPPTVLAAFLAQFYGDKQVPPEVLVNLEPEERGFLETALSEQAGRRVAINHRLRGERARWVAMAVENAQLALKSRLGSRAGYGRRLEALREALGLDEPPRRMECFDISHSRGERTVASCVVFDAEGPRKSDYRRFNIDGITPGDDYAALEQALTRRYRRVQQGEFPMPDLLFVDGGKGQLNAVRGVLEELGIQGLTLIGVAKGPDRKPGAEQLWRPDATLPLLPGADSPALHLVQQIRDEAHRFAITGHRQRRDRQRRESQLESIPGVGAKRRRELLRHFGSAAGVSNATVEELRKIPGISATMAQAIYDYLHGVAD
jgi:excinuclease ABC subunit C